MSTFMSTFSDTSPILIKKRKGDSTEPFKPKIDNLRIINNIAVLDEIPDKFRRVNIEGMFEKRTDYYDENNNISENEYIVDYKLGFVYFHEKMNDKTVKAEYLGIGVVLYPSSRIYDTGRKDVIVTIQEMIDGGRKAIEAYSSIDKAIEVAKDYYVKISTANEEAKQINETLNITIVNGKDINEILKNSIKEATDIDNTLNKTIVNGTNKIVEMDEKLKKVEEISTKTSSTIETAKQTDEVLNKTIVNGKNTDDILNETIRKSTDAHNILNGSVIEGTNKIVEIDNKTKEVNLNEENRVTEEVKRVDAEKKRESNELSRQQGYSNMQNNIDNFSICEEYNPDKEYKKFNRVILNGSSYECVKDCQGIMPTDINNWICIAKKGQDGTGNMSTDDWDRDGDGIIDFANDSNKLGGKLANEYALKSEVSSNVNIKPFKNTAILEEESNRVKIGILEFNMQIDELLVYQNGIYIEKDKEYKITLDGLYIEKIGGNWNKDTVFNFVMYKGVKDKIEYEDGSLILNGSITFDKLNLDIQNKINNTNSNNIERKTYKELTTLINESKLITGGIYLLTDYKTIYKQPISDEIKMGETEELYLVATSINTLSPQAYSKQYPQDIIIYDVNNNIAEDKTTPRNGFILRRTDTVNRLSAPQDWRIMRWKRYNISSTHYNNGQSNVLYRVWESGNQTIINALYKVDNSIYLAVKEGIPKDNTDSNYFLKVCNDRTNIIYYASSTQESIKIAPNVYLLSGDADYLPTFGEGCGNIYIGDTINNIPHNNVFRDNCSNIILGDNCVNNSFDRLTGSTTFGVGCMQNVIIEQSGWIKFNNNASKNIVINSQRVDIGLYGTYNIFIGSVSNQLLMSTYDNVFISSHRNRVGIQANNNIFNFRVQHVILGALCSENKFNFECQNITLGVHCNNNSFGEGCSNITLGQASSENILEDRCDCISLLAGGKSNHLESECKNIILNQISNENHFMTKSSNINALGCISNNMFDEGATRIIIHDLQDAILLDIPIIKTDTTKVIQMNTANTYVYKYVDGTGQVIKLIP